MFPKKCFYQSGDTHYVKTPLVSVIVPVYRDKERLRKLLRALERQTWPQENLEVVVVNNDPADDLSLLAKEFPGITVVAEGKPGSYSARNTGVRAAKGEILAFTDADCVPQVDWLQKGVQAFMEKSGIGMLAGRVEVIFQDTVQPNACELYDFLVSFRQREFIERYRYGVTANLFTSREVFRVVGLFDSNLRSGGDCEWSNRLFRHGYLLQYCDTAVVNHPARSSPGALIRKSLRVTIGAMNTIERYNHGGMNVRQYVWYNLVQRPADIMERMKYVYPSLGSSMNFKVLGIYFLIKGLQCLERMRVKLGGLSRR